MKILLLVFLTIFSTLGIASTYPVLVQRNPFYGSAFFVPNDTNKHTSIVMLHGSEGGSDRSLYSEANILATQGFAVLALCYFDCNRGITDPRKTLKDVEVTTVLDAVAWLRTQSQSNNKVVVYGASRGAELAMILGSLLLTDANKPNALIAHSPSDVFVGAWNWGWLNYACWLCKAGIDKCPKDSPESDYQWNSSCGPDDPDKIDNIKSAWLISGISIPANKRIEIEKYDGPILITVGDKDEVWPVEQTKRIETTLKEAGRKPEIHYFPGEGHNFKWAAELARREMVLDFLNRVPGAPSSMQNKFWQFENIDASYEQAEALKNDMNKCEKYLSPIFNTTPLDMTIYTYGLRESFINDLQVKLNYSKETAERFRNGGAPKPSKGLFLVPPKMTGKYFCHEIVHKYVEMIVPESKIAKMKWFDEGSAEYFSARPFNYQLKKDNEYLRNNISTIIPIEKMISRADWSTLFDKAESRKQAYLQSHSMFNFFIEKFGTKTYLEFLQKMNKDTFENILHEFTGTNLQEFFGEWKKSLEN